MSNLKDISDMSEAIGSLQMYLANYSSLDGVDENTVKMFAAIVGYLIKVQTYIIDAQNIVDRANELVKNGNSTAVKNANKLANKALNSMPTKSKATSFQWVIGNTAKSNSIKPNKPNKPNSNKSNSNKSINPQIAGRRKKL
jgi:hypothetical protein